MADILQETQTVMDEIQAGLETLTPRQVSDYTVKLSGYLSTLGEELANREKAYYQKWKRIRNITVTDGAAEKEAHATEEYYQRRLCDLKMKAVKEQIQSLKKRMNMLSDEAHGKY